MKSYQKYFSACVLALLTQAAFADGRSNSGSGSNSGAASLSNFAVLAGTAVTCTSSTVTGDVGSLGAFTNTGCTITGGMPAATNAAARTAYAAFLVAYAALKPGPTPTIPPCIPLSGTLNRTLPAGVYCFDAAVATTDGTLVLTGTGPWTFIIGAGGTGALTGTNFNVIGGNPCNVKWWVAQGVTMTDSNFQGTILAGADITLTRGTLNGNAWAGGKGTTVSPLGAVTMTNEGSGTGVTVTGCGALSGSSSCKGKKHHKHKKGHDRDDDDDDGDHHGDGDDDDDGDKKKENGNHPFNR